MRRLRNILTPPAFHNICAWRPESDAMAQFADGARDSRIDFARCLGALAVIYLHCADRYTWNDPAFTRTLATFIYANTLFCVPLFFMISGMLLIGRKIDPFAATMQRRLLTVLKPFAFGAALYLIWQIAYQRQPPVSAFAYLQSLLGGSPFFHLWFLPVLFSLYLLLPLFQGFSPAMGKSIACTAAILFIIGGAQSYLNPLNLFIGQFNGSSAFLPYFLAGYCLSKVFTLDRRFSILVCIFAPLGTTGLIMLSSAIAGHREGFSFEEFASPLVVLQSLAMFSLFLKAKLPPAAARLAISFAPQTLGIYILHFAFMSMLSDLANVGFHWSHLEIMLIIPLITYFVSDATVRLLHLIPGMKGYV